MNVQGLQTTDETPARPTWWRRAALSLAAVFVVAGLGFAPAASAQDSSTTEAPSTETVPAGAKAAVESPPRELTTGEVDDDSLYIIEEYRIDGDKILPNGDTPIPALTQKVWDRFANLFPAASRPEIDLLVGIGQEGSNGTDGALQTSALDPSKRYMALDVSGAVEFKELTRTMIHEYAHLLQFRPSAVQAGTKGDPCDVYDGGEECPKEGSYLRLWDKAFYPGVTDGEDYPSEEADIVARYSPDKYVTNNYSATNPAEDMAETFAEWVLLDAPTGPSFVNNDPHYKFPVTGNRVIDQKLRFFDQFPELVALRASIREHLGLAALQLEAPSDDDAPSSADGAPSSDDDSPAVAAEPLTPAFTG
ncbi:MAG: hypothetical protein R2754_03950 [Microthrixaceae bacterium]